MRSGQVPTTAWSRCRAGTSRRSSWLASCRGIPGSWSFPNPRGLDIGATEYVRSELLARRASGAALLLVSEDLDELLALADRLIVLCEGRIVGEMGTAEADPDRLGLLMAGRIGDHDGRAA